jgi:hypothetical protein
MTPFAQADPAGGAAIGEVIVATGGAFVATALLFGLGFAHRAGRTRLLAAPAEHIGRISRLPGWVALPSAVTTASLITALLGMYWDISLHIDEGRDPGPLANPAHYLILFGLFGIFASGFLAMALADGRHGPSFVRLYGDWYAPLGALVLCACGGFALIGFPLDDGWHRLFGQDVTLWGPTHLMLIGGASMSLVGQAILLAEGARAAGVVSKDPAIRRLVPLWLWVRRSALAGSLLIGLSTFQAEFDFGVPQFDMLFQPMLIALAASIGLVAARIWGGRGAALAAVAFFLGLRGFVSLMVGGVWDETTPTIPLYLVEALLVEGAALVLSTKRPLALGATAGALIGSVGLAAEWGWSHVWTTLPWPGSLLPEVLLVTLSAGIAGGLLGALMGVALRVVPQSLPAGTRIVFPAASLALLAFGLSTSAPSGASARVQLTDVPGGSGRQVAAKVTLDPPSIAAEKRWLTITAWQGGGRVVDRLEKVAPGVYRTTRAIPVHDDWKAMIRLHSGRSLLAVPLYPPEDPAIPAKAIPAAPSFERPFVRDKKVLQREAKPGALGLTIIGYATVLAIALSLLGFIAWSLARLAGDDREEPAAPRPARPPRPGHPASRVGTA